MIKQLDVANFTVFREIHLELGARLNVVVGENGAGKTHLLKLAYSILATSFEQGRKPGGAAPTKAALQGPLAEKLVNVFRPESLGRLATRKQGRTRCDIEVRFEDAKQDVSFGFATQSKAEVQLAKVPTAWLEAAPAYLPTRELLTIYPNFLAVYDGHYLEFDETWRDTCVLLGAPLKRGTKEAKISALLKPLEEAMGGRLELDKSGRFYLNLDSGRMEMPLVAEGLRKLAMLGRLVATGALLDQGYLFWDEPEANLNPRIIKRVAKTIVDLASHGIQVFAATHSLFLLRELEILLGDDRTGARFFGLHSGDEGVTVQQGSTASECGDLAVLDEELEQSGRYLEREAELGDARS